MSDREFEPGVGCRSALLILGLFVALAVVGGIVFFTGDPEAVSFWRRWGLGATLPVSGLLVGLGAGGIAWSLDLLVLLGAAVWAARPDDPVRMRRRVVSLLVALAVLGAVTASL